MQHIKGEIRKNYPLSQLTWLKVGGPADLFFKPLDTADLAIFLKELDPKIQVTVLGAGSNMIIRDKGISGAVIKLGRNFTDIALVDSILSVGAGCLNYNLAQFCKVNSIKGFEFLVGIPGTIGGGVAMNAGAYGREFCNIIHSIEALDRNGNIHSFSNQEIGFKYRKNSISPDLIITKAYFNTEYGNHEEISALMNQINTSRRETQPINQSTGGSTFANPSDHKAWELIDKAGLRGYRIGNTSMSEIHCNFMINHGSATAEDMEELGEYVRQKVFETSNVQLQWEIKIIGKK